MSLTSTNGLRNVVIPNDNSSIDSSQFVKIIGDQTISGNKTFDGRLIGTLGSISLTSGYLYDSNGVPSIDLASRQLVNAGNITTVDWDAGTLGTTIGGGIAIDFQNSKLKDSSSVDACDWENKTFASSWDFTNGATSSNLGTDWSAIGNTEVVTKAAVNQRELDALVAEPGITTLTCFGGGDIQTSTNGGGSVSNGEMSSRNRTHNTALSYGVSRHPLVSVISLANGDAINFGQSLFFGVTYTTSGADYRKAGTCSYIYAGTSHTYLPSSDPSTLGFGWKIQEQTITPIFYKTSLVSGTANTSVLSSGGATRQQLWLAIYSDGAGNVSWYINGTLQYTTSAGPIAQGATNNVYASVGVYGDGTQTSYADCCVARLDFGKPR